MRQLKFQVCIISGVGLQGHYNLTWPDGAGLESAIEDFAKLGVKVMITELDVDVLPAAWDQSSADSKRNFGLQKKLNPYQDGLPPAIQQQLADRYADLFARFLRHRNVISRVTL